MTFLSGLTPELVVEGVSRETASSLGKLVQQSLLLNVPLADAAGTEKKSIVAQPLNRIMLCAAADDQTLARIFDEQFTGGFQVTNECDLAQSSDRLVGLLQTGNWFLSLTSNSIYKSSFINRLSNKIAEGVRSSSSQRDLIYTAVSEAVSNGIIHGNLGLELPAMATIDEFTNFHKKIDEQLRAAPYGARHIVAQIWTKNSDCWVSIEDEGIGYDQFKEKKAVMTHLKDNQKSPERRRSGRGLDIIHNLAKEVRIENRGRRLMMRF